MGNLSAECAKEEHRDGDALPPRLHGARLELGAKSLVVNRTAATLTVVHGGGRGCSLNLEAPVIGVWIPLRGRLQLGASDMLAYPGELRVTEPESNFRAVGRGGAVWVALFGTPQVWRQVIGRASGPTTGSLLPACHEADFDLRRGAVAMARAEATRDLEASAEMMIDRVLSLQARFAPAIASCPGRTYAQRRQVFLRLQRVRNYLAANCHLDVDNDTLAKMASYSPSHFIRAFGAAYGETPHAYLIRKRLEYARRLLRTSPLAISEVALASGFESRCTFSRLFRERYGTTAGAMRAVAAGVRS